MFTGSSPLGSSLSRLLLWCFILLQTSSHGWTSSEGRKVRAGLPGPRGGRQGSKRPEDGRSSEMQQPLGCPQTYPGPCAPRRWHLRHGSQSRLQVHSPLQPLAPFITFAFQKDSGYNAICLHLLWVALCSQKMLQPSPPAPVDVP